MVDGDDYDDEDNDDDKGSGHDNEEDNDGQRRRRRWWIRWAGWLHRMRKGRRHDNETIHNNKIDHP